MNHPVFIYKFRKSFSGSLFKISAKGRRGHTYFIGDLIKTDMVFEIEPSYKYDVSEKIEKGDENSYVVYIIQNGNLRKYAHLKVCYLSKPLSAKIFPALIPRSC